MAKNVTYSGNTRVEYRSDIQQKNKANMIFKNLNSVENDFEYVINRKSQFLNG